MLAKRFKYDFKRTKGMKITEISSDAPKSVQAGGQMGLLPRCQHCGADPAPVIPAFTQFGSGKVAVWLCGNADCRAIHSVQLVGVEQPQDSPLVVPGRM